jgi:uncharacterized protein YjbJ (UPF0337 family)
MTMSSRIKRVVRGAKRGAQVTKGRAKQVTGRAIGNDKLRREGKVEEVRGKLNRFAQKVKDTIKP